MGKTWTSLKSARNELVKDKEKLRRIQEQLEKDLQNAQQENLNLKEKLTMLESQIVDINHKLKESNTFWQDSESQLESFKAVAEGRERKLREDLRSLRMRSTSVDDGGATLRDLDQREQKLEAG